MATVSAEGSRPFPPGEYPVVVVGSGPGGLQTSYVLRSLGIHHAVVSSDPAPGGMFRDFPLFQRLITWTKPYAAAERGTREYERYDWNSLLGDEPAHRALLPPLMDGTSYFPSRSEMEAGLVAFADAATVEVRYGCRWESTAVTEGGYTLTTSDGEYRCKVLVVAVGMTQPWKPALPGVEDVPHYVDTAKPHEYAGQRVFVIGKRNSGFEIADGLLPWARQIVVASPRPPVLSVMTHSTAAARARYLQPYEDHVLAGGTFVLDAAIERIERHADGYVVRAAGTSRPHAFELEVDRVIAATGFATPLVDLPKLGLATFYNGGRLPAQTPFWESPTLPAVYFAGNITQGAIGMKKYGIPSNSGAVHGFRYNARVLGRHIAERHFGVAAEPTEIDRAALVDILLAEATTAPELWNQQSYLARAFSFEPDGRTLDREVVPLAHFVDAAGPDAVAITIETDDKGDTHPAAYVRRDGRVEEVVLESHPLHDYRTDEHRAPLRAALGSLVD